MIRNNDVVIIKRTIEIGYNAKSKKKMDVKIELVEREGKKHLSLTGEHRHAGRVVTPLGQCDSSMFEVTDLAIPREDVEMLYGIWNTYHLNGMQAACEHQQVMIDTETPGWQKKELEVPSYEGATTLTKRASYHVGFDEHPEGLIGKPCPVCSYKYGAGWRFLDVPEWVVTFLRRIGVAQQ